MFLDFGWSEIMLISVVALVVIGPKDLPRVMRTVSYWVRKARNLSQEFQGHVDEMMRDSELSEIREDLKKVTHFDLDHHVEETIDPEGSLREGLALPAPEGASPQASEHGEAGASEPQSAEASEHGAAEVPKRRTRRKQSAPENGAAEVPKRRTRRKQSASEQDAAEAPKRRTRRKRSAPENGAAEAPKRRTRKKQSAPDPNGEAGESDTVAATSEPTGPAISAEDKTAAAKS